MVEEARLESVYTPKVYRGFESRSLRKFLCRKEIVLIIRLLYRKPNKTTSNTTN